MEFEHVTFDLPHGTFHGLQGGDPDGRPTLVLYGFPDHPSGRAVLDHTRGPGGQRVLRARLTAEPTGAKQGDDHTMAERWRGTEPTPTGDPITRGGRRMAQAADAARTVILTVDDDPGVSRAV
ncbi:hypothetical protein, partial [Streptomyces sp. NPDC001658]